MISIQKIILGFILGSSFLVFVALQLFSPSVEVQASNESLVLDDPSIELGEPQSEIICTLSISFPESIQKWCQLIEANAEIYNLEPNLIAAVMLQESGGNPDAISSSGAVGLMQIMPRDGIASQFMCINGPCFSNRPTIQELLDPAFNIDFGSQMLLNLFSKHGNWREALLAYGPMDMGYRYADIVLNIYQTYQ